MKYLKRLWFTVYSLPVGLWFSTVDMVEHFLEAWGDIWSGVCDEMPWHPRGDE